MALAIDNTPLSPTANSYVGDSEMATYVADRVADSAVRAAWNALSVEARAMYLVNATRQLDAAAAWNGTRYSEDQQLGWPRYLDKEEVDGFYVDYLTIPVAIKHATCELALWLLSNNGAVYETQDASYDSIKVGPLTIDFNEGAGGPGRKYFPEIVSYLLRGYGTLQQPDMPGSNMAKSVRLIRA